VAVVAGFKEDVPALPGALDVDRLDAGAVVGGVGGFEEDRLRVPVRDRGLRLLEGLMHGLLQFRGGKDLTHGNSRRVLSETWSDLR